MSFHLISLTEVCGCSYLYEVLAWDEMDGVSSQDRESGTIQGIGVHTATAILEALLCCIPFSASMHLSLCAAGKPQLLLAPSDTGV